MINFTPIARYYHEFYIFYILFSITRALRLTNSWSESRDVFNAEAIKIRKQFDQNKNIPAGKFRPAHVNKTLLSINLNLTYFEYDFDRITEGQAINSRGTGETRGADAS